MKPILRRREVIARHLTDSFRTKQEIYMKHKKRMASSEMLRLVALVRTDVKEERSASFKRVTRIGEIGTTLSVTSNRKSGSAANRTRDLWVCSQEV
jgi:hypothetical protein